MADLEFEIRPIRCLEKSIKERTAKSGPKLFTLPNRKTDFFLVVSKPCLFQTWRFDLLTLTSQQSDCLYNIPRRREFRDETRNSFVVIITSS